MATSFYTRFPGGQANITGSVDVNIHDSAGNDIDNGQQTMANSVPVVIASNQTAVPVSAATLPLPSGAATAANQATEIASLASIDGKFGSLGQKAMTGSAPVVIASDQSAIPVSAASLPLPSGAATEATLSTLNGKVTACNTGAVVVSSSALPSGASTAAKQPALGTAGTASADVITVQGITSMTPLLVNGSGSTQPTREATNTNGSIVNTALTATTASTASVPGNAVGFVLEAPSTNTDNVRWCIGGTASTTVGMLTEPGRDTGYIPCSANISVCATVSGTNAFSIQWVLSS